MSHPDQYLEDLIVRHLGGELQPDEERELAALLKASPAARALLASYMRIEGATIQLATAGCLTDPRSPSELPPAAVPPPAAAMAGSGWRWTAAFWSAAACLLVALGLYLAQTREPRPAGTSSAEVKSVASFARLVRSVDVAWTDDVLPTVVGARLPAARYQMTVGLAEIRLDSGVSLVVEAPAEFELLTEQRAYLYDGKIRGTVPPGAEGFTVASADMTVVDLGTEFGLQVDETGSSEVHVFDGEVQLHRAAEDASAGAPHVITAGRAVRIDASGEEHDMDADDSSFVGRDVLADVTTAYLQELERQVETLVGRGREIKTQLRMLSRNVQGSPEYSAAMRQVDAARAALHEFRQSHAELVEFDRKIGQARDALEAIAAKRLESDRRVVGLRNELAGAQAAITDVKQKMQDARQQGDRRLFEQLRDQRQVALDTKSRVSRRLRTVSIRIRRNDPAVQAAARQLEAVRRAAAGQQDRAPYDRLLAALEVATKAQQAARKKLSKNHPEMRRLRAEAKVIQSRLLKARQDIRNAREADAV